MNLSPAEWIKGIAASALICGIALSLCPAGKVKSVLKITCGVVMLLSLISPILNGDLPEYIIDTNKYIKEANDLINADKDSYSTLDRTYIESSCETYILNRASSLGVNPFNIKIIAEWNDQGFFYPFEAHISGQITPQDKNSIAHILESELGISSKNQIWGGGDEQ